MQYYNIIEVANTHGGDLKYLLSLLDEFSDIDAKDNTGIKFQPFSPDGIALSDFEFYEVYKKLHFTEAQWNQVIDKASETKQVWLDVFDLYGVKIFEGNQAKITGLKLQTSVLENREVLGAFEKLDLSKHKLIINIAGRELNEIKSFVEYFESKVKPQELLLEVGFQAYPTEFQDSGLGKIELIKNTYGKRIVFADHIDGTHSDALLLPLMALFEGADIIEKHVMHSELETAYDKFSSITRVKFDEIIANQKRYGEVFKQDFINDRERVYLEKSIQLPILNKSILKGQGIRAEDISFKRTAQKGVLYSELKNMLNGKYVAERDLEKGKAIQKEDLKKIKIATIIAARLKSSRLKEKAKLKIGNLSSVELCIKNALRFKDVDYTILATSTTDQDSELEKYTYDKKVIFHKGDPDDVIQRYLDITRKLGIDVVIRVTGDNVYIAPEVAEFLLASHFASGADYTSGKEAAIGTNLEIINVAALEKVKRHFVKADYSEYMTWYFMNNPEHFKLNIVELPKEWVRNYRLTLDHQEDLDMYNLIENYFIKNKIEFNLVELFKFLDTNPEIAKMNSHIGLKFRTDQTLIDTLNKVTKIPADAKT
ncbi:MAG: N-acetylneuraminate synthase family protein [Sphingobacteriaceae bacterium]|nr:N-acetylneuraminate synthase family protein [Sphingobacteriaceae bacterium]